MTPRSRRYVSAAALEVAAAIAAGIGMLAGACWLLETFGGVV